MNEHVKQVLLVAIIILNLLRGDAHQSSTIPCVGNVGGKFQNRWNTNVNVNNYTVQTISL